MKTLKTISILVLLLSASFLAKAQAQITVADGTELTDKVPVQQLQSFRQNNRIIYPEDLLKDLVGGKIEKMTFYSDIEFCNFPLVYYPNDTVGYSVAEIRIAETTEQFLSSVPDININDTADMTLVWRGNILIEDYKLVFNFEKPFTYIEKSLVISILVLNPPNSTFNVNFYGETTLNTQSG